MDGNGRNSPYALALVKYIAKPGLSIKSVFKGVRKQVKQTTGNKQTPWYNASMENEFYFSQALVKPPSLVPDLSNNSETVFWTMVSQKNTPDYAQFYLNKYGDRGLYSEIALFEFNRLTNSSEAAQKPVMAQLTVKTSPANARVRILNIGPKYKDIIELNPGRYHIEVSLSGYAQHTEWLTLEAENKVHSVVLTAIPEAAVARYQPVANIPSVTTATKKRHSQHDGIKMVWVEPGCFQMGGTQLGTVMKNPYIESVSVKVIIWVNMKSHRRNGKV